MEKYSPFILTITLSLLLYGIHHKHKQCTYLHTICIYKYAADKL